MKTLAKIDNFGTQFSKAAKGRSCMVIVSASRGTGAIVHYAKAQDADMGRTYREFPGTTTIYFWSLLRNVYQHN
jgi:hypothetical protein